MVMYGRGLEKHLLNLLLAAAESDTLYKLQPHDQDSECLLTVLPQSGAEAELCVPLQWPAKGVPLQLKAIKAASDDVDLLQVDGKVASCQNTLHASVCTSICLTRNICRLLPCWEAYAVTT